MSKPTLYSDSAQPQSFLEELQASLINRFTKVPKRPEPVVYEFTNDRSLLHQYYLLREIMYRRTFDTDMFNGQEDVNDKISAILIARRGKLCIGGCRVTIREADEMFPLPMESEDFKLRNFFPKLTLNKLGHCEISRFAILAEDESKTELMYALSKLSVEKAISSGLGYIFVKSTYPLARNWRVIAYKLGLKNTEICKDIHPPVESALDNEVKRYVVASDITRFSQPESKVKAQPELQSVAASPEPYLTLVD